MAEKEFITTHPDNWDKNRNVLELHLLEPVARGYIIFPLAPSQDSQDKPDFSIAPPGDRPENNLRMGLQGMEGTFNLDFYLIETDWDRSTGSVPFGDGEVKKIAEQKHFLKRYMQHEDFNARWELRQTKSYFGDDNKRIVYDDPIPVSVVNVSFSVAEGGGQWILCSMELGVGDTTF